MTSKSMAYRWCKTDEVDEDLEKSGDKTDAAKNGAQKWQVRQKEAKEPQHYESAKDVPFIRDEQAHGIFMAFQSVRMACIV